MIHKLYSNSQWKKVSEQRYIELYSSNQNLQFNTPPVLLIGGVHGDEPEGVNLALLLLDFFIKLSQKNHTFLNEWLLIPCLNPEGLARRQRVNGNGVDLNRNFPSKDWSPEYTKDRYFPGRSAGSEIETQSVMELINKFSPKLIIHFHSWKPSIIYTGESAKPIAHKFSESSGYSLQDDIGYPTPGSLGQYGFFEHNIGVICIEEEERCDKYKSWERFKKVFEDLF